MVRRACLFGVSHLLLVGLAGCGDDTGSGGGSTASSATNAASSTSASTGLVSIGGGTTVTRVPLAALSDGSVDVTLSPTALGATFLIHHTAFSRPLRFSAQDGQILVDRDALVDEGEARDLGIFMARDIHARGFTLISGFGDAPAGLPGTYTLAQMPPDDDGGGAVSSTSTGMLPPTVYDQALAFVREGTFDGGVVDFNVLVPSTLDRNPHLEDVLSLVMADFGGLALGEVTFVELPADALVLDDPLEATSYLQSVPNVTDAPVVNVLVTTAFAKDGWVFGNGDKLKGESPLPGFPHLASSPLSTVYLRISDDVAYDAVVLRHELGHFGGLYHSEEAALAGYADSFDDTPDCAAFPASCVDPVACGCDVSNLMFPIVLDASPRTLSSSQAKLLQASILHHAGVPAARRRVAMPTFRDWANDLSPRARAHVGSICGAGALSALDDADVRSLASLATNRAVSPAIRRAALEAVGGRAGADTIAMAHAIATDAGAPRDVRLGAVALLERAAPQLVEAASSDPDPAVAQLRAAAARRRAAGDH